MKSEFASQSHLRNGALQEIEYGPGESIAEAVRMLLASELLLHAMLGILASQFALWRVDASSYGVMQCMLVITVILFGVLAPACGKFRVLAYAGFEMGLLAFGGWYGWKYFDRLREGVIGLCADYLLAWNAYYRTNYVVEYNGSEMSDTLAFLILVLVLLFLILRYVTGARWLMLVPPLGALALGLLVDHLAGWTGLVCFFAGTLLLYSGAGEPSRIVFAPVKKRCPSKHPVLAHYWSMVSVAAAALGIVLIAGNAFEAPAGKIPEKTPEFMAFQNRLENAVLSLGSGIHIRSGQERLDNSTPVYNNEVILTISADRMPLTNLYLPEFYSGTYQNGSWRQEKRAYRSAAGESGTDGDHMGTLLRQMGYEYLSMLPYTQFSGEGGMSREYTINYGEKRTTSAWIPYFADLNSLQDEVWVEDEGLVKKKWNTTELSFVGWGGNAELYEFLAHMDLFEDAVSEKAAVDWYSDYVWEHYQGKSGIPAVRECAEEQLQEWDWLTRDDLYWDYAVMSGNDIVQIGERIVYGKELRSTVSSEDPYYTGEDAMTTNAYRLAVADAVRNQLADRAYYNLYLSDIPAGTDTIQYFLETGHEGYCMHFASAGALILQELGIPARYASGYIVKRNAFRGTRTKGVSATVYDRNAHAWVEVYLENIGWVPVEMTPGYETEANELPTDSDKQEALMQRHEQREEESEQKTPNKELQRPDDTESGPEGSTEEDKESTSGQPDSAAAAGTGGSGGGTGAGIAWRTAAIYAGAAVLALLVALAVVLAVRYGLQRYREALWAELRKKQNRRAVMRMNRRIYRRLQGGGFWPMGHIRFSGHAGGKAGVQWLGITDIEYEQKLAAAYPAILPQAWAEYMRIVKKAAFSQEEVLAQEVQLCYQIYQTHRKKK